VKRAGIRPGAKSVQRGSTFKAPRNPRQQAVRKSKDGWATRRYQPGKLEFQDAARAQLACMNPACPRPSAPWNAHHVVYAQHVRLEGGDEWDVRNAMRLCTDCHDRHHSGARRLAADVLPPAAVAFAHALLGERAIDYLRTYYPAL
jgi:5-methylcytosine-specific restriction endonuclease McrA